MTLEQARLLLAEERIRELQEQVLILRQEKEELEKQLQELKLVRITNEVAVNDHP